MPANGDVYAVVRKVREFTIICVNDMKSLHHSLPWQVQDRESEPAPVLFEEDDTYWEPADDARGLYEQLSAKKYREIVRSQIQYVN